MKNRNRYSNIIKGEASISLRQVDEDQMQALKAERCKLLSLGRYSVYDQLWGELEKLMENYKQNVI